MSNTGSLITLGVIALVMIFALSLVGIIDLTPSPYEKKTTGLLFDNEGNIVPEIPLDWTGMYIALIAIPIVIFLLSGIRVIRQTHRAVVETFGKYKRFQDSGITWIIPIVQKLYSLNVTELLVDVQKQDVITLENLNASVDAQVYYRISDDEKNLKNAFYNVNNVNAQMVQLAKSTLRAVIGKKAFKEVNSNRKDLNDKIFETLKKETEDWGIKIVRVELKEITPPPEVQDTMNAIIMAENKRDAEKDLAQAKKIEADGDKMARIQRAEGFKREQVLRAEGEAEAIVAVAEADAEAIKLVNTSAQLHFRKEAIILKHLQVTQNSLENNSKIVLTKDGITPTLVLNESAKDIIPTPKGYDRNDTDDETLRKDLKSTYIRRRSKSTESKWNVDPEAVNKLLESRRSS